MISDETETVVLILETLTSQNAASMSRCVFVLVVRVVVPI